MITFDNLKIYRNTTRHGEHIDGKFKAFKKPKIETLLVHDFSHDYVDIERFLGFLIANQMDMLDEDYKMECKITIHT